jgi:hypothetical protein
MTISPLLAAYDKRHAVPVFSKILSTYEADCPDKAQRLGQWFFNRCLRGVITEIKYPYNFDALYNSTDFEVIFNILEKMYADYQWPLA